MNELHVSTQTDLNKLDVLKDRFAFDVETRDADTNRLSSDWYNLEVFAFSLYDGQTSIFVDCRDNEQFIQDVFNRIAPDAGKNKTVIAHNIPFDIKALRKHGVSLYNADWFDTLIAHHLIDERQQHGLKKLAGELLGADTTELETAYTPGQMSEQFIEYTRNDTIWTYQLAERFWPELKKQGLDTLFKKVEMPFQRCIVEMEMNGVRFNEELCQEYKKKLKDAINNMVIEMCEAVGCGYTKQFTLEDGVIIQPEINFNSNQQLRQLLYDDFGLEPPKETEAGNASVDTESLEQLEHHHEVIPILLEYKKANKLLTGFFNSIDDLVDDDGRIRSNYLDFGAETGRLSSRDPNQQNLPSGDWRGVKTRECFEASKGKKMVAIDYDGQENRVACQVSEDPQFIEDIKEEKDLHLVNADIIFGIDEPEEHFYKDHPEYKRVKKENYDKRQKAKTFSYGILYGATEYRMKNVYNVDEETAKQWIDEYFERYDKLKEAKERYETMAEEKGYSETLYGRKRHFDKERIEDSFGYRQSCYRKAFNHPIQGTSADMMRVAMIKLLNYKHNNPEYGVDLLMTVHDEVVLECNEEHAEQVAEDAEQLLASVVGDEFVVDMPAEAGIGDNYTEAK